jgi:hypothetical protein
MKIFYFIAAIATAYLCATEIPCVGGPTISPLTVFLKSTTSFLYVDPTLEYPAPMVSSNYYYHSVLLPSKPDAIAICLSFGKELVTIKNEEEHLIIR